MLLFQLLPWLGLLVNLLLCGTAFRCWRRTGQPGFLLLSMAFLLLLLPTLVFQLLLPISGPTFLFRTFAPPLQLVIVIAAGALMFRGLLSLADALPWRAEVTGPAGASGQSTRQPQQPRDWPQQWRRMRRTFFSTLGPVLLLVAPPMAILNGTGAGVAIVAALTGGACLWLGLHPSSPLAEKPRDAPRLDADPPPPHALHSDGEAQPPNPL